MKIIVNCVAFGQHEARYTQSVILREKRLISEEPEWDLYSSKSVREALAGIADKKGVVNHSAPVPYVYQLRDTKANRIIGSGVDTLVEAIIKNQYTAAKVYFAVCLDNDSDDVEDVSNTFTVTLPFTWELPEGDDLEANKAAVEQLLFTGNQFTYGEDKWPERILKASHQRWVTSSKANVSLKETKDSLVRSASLYSNYIKDMSSVLTPDIPQEVFTDTWDADDKGMLVIQALTSVSKKVAELVVASEKKDELPITSGKVKEAFEEANQRAVDLDSALNQKHGLIQMNPRFSFTRAHATLSGSAKAAHYVSEQLRQAKEK